MPIVIGCVKEGHKYEERLKILLALENPQFSNGTSHTTEALTPVIYIHPSWELLYHIGVGLLFSICSVGMGMPLKQIKTLRQFPRFFMLNCQLSGTVDTIDLL